MSSVNPRTWFGADPVDCVPQEGGGVEALSSLPGTLLHRDGGRGRGEAAATPVAAAAAQLKDVHEAREHLGHGEAEQQ